MAGPLFQPYYIAKILDGPLNLCKKHLFPTLMQHYEGNRQMDKVTYRVTCALLKMVILKTIYEGEQRTDRVI